MSGKALNLIFCSAHFFGISALCVPFALCWQDKYKATTVILSPDQRFALLQYSYTKVPLCTSLRMKLGSKGLGTTEQEGGLESRDGRRLRECEGNAGGWMNEWMSAGGRWSEAGGEERLVLSMSLAEAMWLPEKSSWRKSGWRDITRRLGLDGSFGETS